MLLCWAQNILALYDVCHSGHLFLFKWLPPYSFNFVVLQHLFSGSLYYKCTFSNLSLPVSRGLLFMWGEKREKRNLLNPDITSDGLYLVSVTCGSVDLLHRGSSYLCIWHVRWCSHALQRQCLLDLTAGVVAPWCFLLLHVSLPLPLSHIHCLAKKVTAWISLSK